MNPNSYADELLEEAIELVRETQSASISMFQRRFRIGYTKAAHLMDEMEKRKIVSPYAGAVPRKALIK
jgi:S-DNA-T family DNA segregation ATPase FtsK/SpoIIIE